MNQKLQDIRKSRWINERLKMQKCKKCIDLKLEIEILFQQKEYDQIRIILEDNCEEITLDNDLSLLYYIVDVYNTERYNQLEFTIFTMSKSIDEVIGLFTVLKFMLRRIEFNMPDALNEFYLFVIKNRISAFAIQKSAEFACINLELVFDRIKEGA